MQAMPYSCWYSQDSEEILAKHSWFKTFGIAAIMYSPTTFLYSFATKATYIPIMLVVRLSQHFIGVGLNLTFANMVYVNLPRGQDKLHLLSSVGANLSAFLGMLTGTTFVAVTKNFVINLGNLALPAYSSCL